MAARVGIDPNSDYQEIKVQKDTSKLIDTRLMAGPLAERSCTDILCLLLFIANVIALGYISYTGYTAGEPLRLIAAYDPDKKACGLDVKGYDYLYWAFPYKDRFNRTTCVKECPTYQSSIDKPNKLQCSPNVIVESCDQYCMDLDSIGNGVTFPPNSNQYNMDKFVCVYNTSISFDRICMPTDVLDLVGSASEFTGQLNMDKLSVWTEDLSTTSTMIYASFGIAFVLGILYMLFTRVFAGVLVWLSILLYFIGIGVLTWLCYDRYKKYDKISNDTDGQYTFEETQNASDNAFTFQICFYIMLGILGFSIIGFLCLYNKLRLAVAVIKTAAIFIKDEFLIIFVPPATALFMAGLWFWWIFTAIFVYSLGKIEGDGQSPFATVTLSEETIQMLWYFVFGGLWTNALLLAVNDFVIASACCIWYFSQGTGQGAHKAISNSLYRAFRYHFGSLAFGSLILAIVQFIRVVLEYIRVQVQAAGADKKKNFILKCLACYMACFERFIRFLNRNAYIQIALTGKSFCPAAKEAFETIFANSMRYSLVSGIGGAFIFVGKAFISIATVTIFYYIITGVDAYSEKLFSALLPCIVVFIIAYSVALLFMAIYGMACDTILACFIHDEDLNKQNGGTSAQHCPETLREFMNTPELVKKMQQANEKQ